MRREVLQNELKEDSKAYGSFRSDIETRIHRAQDHAAQSVNRDLILLYWHTGREILKRQTRRGSGSRVLEQLSLDLRRKFPGLKGFSPRNLKCMRAFAEAWPDEELVQQVIAQIPWGHNVRLLDLVKSSSEREWYIQQTLQHGWSRDTLIYQIETGLYQRQGKSAAAPMKKPPTPPAPITQQILKDPYIVDLLELGKETLERDLERGVLNRLQNHLIRLKDGFAFVGDQVHLDYEGEDLSLDLLFYHLKLRCYVAIDVRLGPFQTEYTGKMNSYLMAVDDLLRYPGDQPSIGINLHRHKSRVIVEYALRKMKKPIGVSAYQLMHVLPKKLKGSLPTISELEAELKQIQHNH